MDEKKQLRYWFWKFLLVTAQENATINSDWFVYEHYVYVLLIEWLRRGYSVEDLILG